MRGKTLDRLAVKRAARRHLMFGAFEVAAVTDDEVSAKRLHRCWDDEDDHNLYAAELRHLLRAMARHDRDAAARFLSEVVDAEGIGLVVSKAVRVRASHDVEREVLEAAAAAGGLAAAVAHAAPVEEQESAAQTAVREAVEAAAAIRTLSSAQRPLPMAEGR